MESTFGNRIRITLCGESHGPSVSARVTGLPAGIPLDIDGLNAFLSRRSGGKKHTTARKETDIPFFSSGITNGKTNGQELVVGFKNENVNSSDYDAFSDTPRPSHADYPARLRYGNGIDLSGGGHFSGRLTAPLCAVGYLCKSELERRGINLGAHLSSLGSIKDRKLDPVKMTVSDLKASSEHSLPVIDPSTISKMENELANAEAEKDSLGGTIECGVIGLPAGVGSPLGHGLENDLSSMLFVLGGLVAVEFGDGFASTKMKGSTHNDPWTVSGSTIETETNHCGGIVAGISTGMPLLFRVAFKPTASIGREQNTVSISRLENTKLKIVGRHDPAIAIRAVPCVEAVCSIVLLSSILDVEDKQMNPGALNRGFADSISNIPNLSTAREQIDRINKDMKDLFVRRLLLASRIGELKSEAGLPTLDPNREKAILDEMTSGLPDDLVPYVKEFFEDIMKISRDRQNKERMDS